MSFLASVFTAGSQLQEGEQEQQAQEFNAKVAEQQAQLTRESSALEEFKARKRLKLVSGEQRALFAKSGVTFSGSVIDVIEESISNAELDIATSNFNAEVKARGFESEAAQARIVGQQARRISRLRAGATLLTGVAQAASFGGTGGGPGTPSGGAASRGPSGGVNPPTAKQLARPGATTRIRP